MKKLFFLVWAIFALPVWGQNLEEILQNPTLFDNKRVIFEGELIGEPLKTKQGLWVNVSGGGLNIGVYLEDPSLAKNIKNFASYKTKGDIVRIEGIFHKSCLEHFERDVHARIIKVVKAGYLKEEVVAPFKKNLSLFLTIICLILAVVYFIKIKYGNRS